MPPFLRLAAENPSCVLLTNYFVTAVLGLSVYECPLYIPGPFRYNRDRGQESGDWLERVQYDVGDVVRMKKKHPCGSDLWEILRTGMDFGIKCKGCGRFVMLPRPKFEKMAKAIVEKAADKPNL